MGLFHIIWSLIVGFFVGFVSRFLMGHDPMGFWATAAVGIIGSFVGGFLSNMIWKPKEGARNTSRRIHHVGRRRHHHAVRRHSAVNHSPSDSAISPAHWRECGFVDRPA